MQETIKVPQLGVPLGGPHNNIMGTPTFYDPHIMRNIKCWGLNGVPLLMETGILKISEKRVPFQCLRDLGGKWNYDFFQKLALRA